MKRISVIVVGLALMVAESAAAQGLPVPLPPLPPLPSLPSPPPVPTVPPVEVPLPEVEVPALPSLPVRAQAPQVPSTGGPSSPGTTGTGTGTSAPGPASAPTRGAGSRGGSAAGGGTSGNVRRSTVDGTSPSARETAGAGSAAAPGRAGRAEPRVVRRERRLRITVRRLEGCVDGLTQLERKVLVLRAGLGDERVHTRDRVARLLDLSTRRVGRIERSGLRRLRALGRNGACGAVLTAGGSAPGPASVAGAPQIWTAPPGDLAFSPDRVEVKGEQDSSSSEPALVPTPMAILPPAAAVVSRPRNGAAIDVTIPMLVVIALVAIAFAVRSILGSLRSD